jgi:predicted 3-demethylubiquinone-9 3-methyltransferase (glyoxalase superfamily)
MSNETEMRKKLIEIKSMREEINRVSIDTKFTISDTQEIRGLVNIMIDYQKDPMNDELKAEFDKAYSEFINADILKQQQRNKNSPSYGTKSNPKLQQIVYLSHQIEQYQKEVINFSAEYTNNSIKHIDKLIELEKMREEINNIAIDTKFTISDTQEIRDLVSIMIDYQKDPMNDELKAKFDKAYEDFLDADILKDQQRKKNFSYNRSESNHKLQQIKSLYDQIEQYREEAINLSNETGIDFTEALSNISTTQTQEETDTITVNPRSLSPYNASSGSVSDSFSSHDIQSLEEIVPFIHQSMSQVTNQSVSSYNKSPDSTPLSAKPAPKQTSPRTK